MLGFQDQNRVAGVSYELKAGGFWLKPFVGYHNQIDVGDNGFMYGWVLSYNYKLFNKNFILSQWHEEEASRAKLYANGNGGSKGLNGALSNWWVINSNNTAGFQYRYAHNKLGTKGTTDAYIFSLKQNF